MRGHIRQRGKDSWSIVLYLGTDAHGKKRQKWHTVHGSKKDAERELRRLLHEMDTGSYVEPSKLTIGEYLERWLNDYVRIQDSAATLARYELAVRSHIKPLIGDIPLSRLEPLHVQRCYADALDHGGKDGRPLSPSTVVQMHHVLHGALNQAVKWQILARNVADAVSPPRRTAQEMRALDEQGVLELLDISRGSRYYMPILLAATTGLRRGEILGLRWDDIDLESGFLTVKRTSEAVKGGTSYKAPKSARGRRLVRLPESTVAALKQHRVEQARRRLILGPDYHDHGLVVCNMDGSPINPWNLSVGFGKLVRRHGIKLRFHDLRHTHATLLLRQGVNPKIVSERLGHSSIGITLDTYSHVLPDMQDQAAKGFDEAMARAAQRRRRVD